MSLLDALRDIATALPPAHVERLASAIEACDGPGPAARNAIARAAPIPVVREQAARLAEAWESDGAPAGHAVALALRAAALAADVVRRTSSLELTWTGPTAGIPVRMTGEAILDLVRGARESLLFMSYSASEIAELVDELQQAAARGVAVTMVFETREGSGGAFASDAAGAYRALRDTVTFLQWPADQRESAGRMHAKAVVADARVALVSSANLSRAAMGTNMELGLLVRGGPVPLWICDHVAHLRSQDVLRPHR